MMISLMSNTNVMMMIQTPKRKVPTNYIEYTTDTYKQSHVHIYGTKHIGI